MGFSEKIKGYFESKNLTNRDVSKLMDGYSEVMISNYNNSDKWKDNYIKKLLEVFPDLDLNYLLKEDGKLQVVEEKKEVYKTRNLEIVEDLEVRLKELKKNLSQ